MKKRNGLGIFLLIMMIVLPIVLVVIIGVAFGVNGGTIEKGDFWYYGLVYFTLGIIVLWYVDAYFYNKVMQELTKQAEEQEKKDKENRIKQETEKFFQESGSGVHVKRISNGNLLFAGEIDLGVLGKVQKEKVTVSCADNSKTDEELVLAVLKLGNNIKENSKKVLDYFLLMMIFEYYQMGNEFWMEYLKGEAWKKEQEDKVFSESFQDKIYNLLDAYSDDGLIDAKVFDTEKFLKQKVACFDLEKFISKINISFITFNIDTMSVSIQLSDETKEIFESAYEEFDENLVPQDWHNF